MTTETQQQTQTAWKFDTARTFIEFAVKHMMVAAVKGRFTEFEGTIYGNPDNPQDARVEVTINAASVDTRNELRDAYLKSDHFLDVEQYPEITFSSTTIEPTAKDAYLVRGDLTIRGVTTEIELEATINGVGRSLYGQQIVGITVTGVLSRREWGPRWNVALETGGVAVGDDVRVNVEFEAIKQEQTAAA
jgi:polyisoprenoid-binding protein YceI